MEHRSGLSRERAEEVAIAALAHLAEDPEVLGRFLTATGLGPETLRAAASQPGFLAAVLEYLMGDESQLLVFAERQRLRPTMIAAARHALDPLADQG
ncbi:DUF3572 family protein [Siculibacillus lacustris]|uniref:DUF3572 family protein n=1 Tax=Siculibacillus lacustris TaxID=1549641 RepID=A0A4Q9VI50_9HYPH|nr:DUF3572 family protein [Siculibacillus lacustris]